MLNVEMLFLGRGRRLPALVAGAGLLVAGASGLPVRAEPGEGQGNAAVKNLEELKWSHRLILVKADGRSGPCLEALRDRKADLEERHLSWFVLDEGVLTTNLERRLDPGLTSSLDARFEVRPGLQVVLVGKDGGVKARADRLDLDELFRLIDAMPMRLREMRE